MRLLKEPLFHFLLIGALLLGIDAWRGDTAQEENARLLVRVTAGDIEHLRESWRRRWQRPPTQEELRGLVDAWVRETILYREALALGLDREDVVVRRRLAQKLEFLTEDLLAPGEVSDSELAGFLAEHAARYEIPPRLSFEHVYFSRDRRGDRVDGDARAALDRLLAGTAPGPAEMGDPILLERRYADLPLSRVERLFGAEFADALAEAPVGRWTGPVPSGYGLHLVRIQERTQVRQPTLAEVRDAVERDYLSQSREEANRKFYESLRTRYRVVYEDGATPGGTAGGAGVAEAAQ